MPRTVDFWTPVLFLGALFALEIGTNGITARTAIMMATAGLAWNAGGAWYTRSR